MRAYRRDVMALLEYLCIAWPKQSSDLLRVTVRDVLDWKESMLEREMAPKSINRRIASVSSLYRYMGAAAAELRLPITIPNPAHSQFIPRMDSEPLEETKSLSATKAWQLMAIPDGESATDYRDRAILKFYVYSGARISTGCRLKVSDFHDDDENPTIRRRTKGNKSQTIGIHYAATEAIRDYLAFAEIEKGPIFRPRLGSRAKHWQIVHYT